MVARPTEKKHLSAKGLIGKIRNVFKKAKEPQKGGQGQKKEISLVDCLTSALAIFKLKFPSLLLSPNARGCYSSSRIKGGNPDMPRAYYEGRWR